MLINNLRPTIQQLTRAPTTLANARVTTPATAESGALLLLGALLPLLFEILPLVLLEVLLSLLLEELLLPLLGGNRYYCWEH